MAQTAPDSVLSHWSTLIENFQTSPLSFYQALEGALKTRQIPATENSRVDYKEAGLMSAERQYLRIRKETLVFDICAAPFGTGFFFSWWFAEETPRMNFILKIIAVIVMIMVSFYIITSSGMTFGLLTLIVLVTLGLWVASELSSQGQFSDTWLRALPLLGTLYTWLFKPGTYYRLDSMQMFQTAVHNAVLEVIDGLTSEKGLRALSESERKPIMHRFYDRKTR